jgi:prepilin-type N-terminal cleavage/methylation domain-containing protein
MKIKNQNGFSLIELIIAVTIFTIVIVGFGASFIVSLNTAKFQKQQALLNTDVQAATKLLDADIRQTGFLFSAGTNNTLPVFIRSGHPVAGVEIVDEGKTLRCYRLGDESGGRVVDGLAPVGAVTTDTTEFTVAGNAQSLAGRVGSSRAFLFISEGLGRRGQLFITNSTPTIDTDNPNLVHLRGSFSSGTCLNVGNSDTAATDYRGLIAIPLSAYIEYRFEEDGLNRYEYPGASNPCGGAASSTKKLLVQASNMSDGRFGYLKSNGDNVLPLPDASFPSLRGVMLVIKRRLQSSPNAEFVSTTIPLTLNSEW